MTRLSGLGTHDSDFFCNWMDGYCQAFEELPDGAWQAACEEAVVAFNHDHGTSVDPYEGWLFWCEEAAKAHGAEPFLFRFRYTVKGGHTHVRVFAGTNTSGTLGKCGDLVFRNEEWQAFVAQMLPFKGLGPNIEFVEDCAD